VRTANPDIFESDDVAKSCPVSYRRINQYGGTTCTPSFSGVNPDTIGYVWTGKFDLNTLLVVWFFILGHSGKRKFQDDGSGCQETEERVKSSKT